MRDTPRLCGAYMSIAGEPEAKASWQDTAAKAAGVVALAPPKKGTSVPVAYHGTSVPGLRPRPGPARARRTRQAVGAFQQG